MAGFRAIRQRARAALHEGLSVPAFYISGTAEPVLCRVRVHTKWGAMGDVKGTSYAYAERQDTAPQIIFLVSEIDPDNGAVVSVAEGEAYRLNNIMPPENITVTAEALRMTAAQAADLPYPDMP